MTSSSTPWPPILGEDEEESEGHPQTPGSIPAAPARENSDLDEHSRTPGRDDYLYPAGTVRGGTTSP